MVSRNSGYFWRALGRKVEHDDRNRLFRSKAGLPIHSVHHRFFGRASDQGHLGGCVGWTGRDWLMTHPIHKTGINYRNSYGEVSYAGATENDEWEEYTYRVGEGPNSPGDQGSSGLGLAKFYVKRDHAVGYNWCFTLDETLSALQVRPLALGIGWTSGMFDPDPQGRIRPTGGVAGGHEILIIGADLSGTRDTWRVWIQNHWTQHWGKNGRAFLSLDDFDERRRADGDVLDMIPAGAK